MEVQGGIGTVGNYDVKLVGGVLNIQLGAQVDLAGELSKVAASITNPVEQEVLLGAIKILQAMNQ